MRTRRSAADILARHHRQRGEDVFFLTGTDEHGEPVARVAEQEGITPQELADRNAQRFLDLLPRINVSNDFFIRTSDPRHKRRVQEVMQRVHDNGHVVQGHSTRAGTAPSAPTSRPRPRSARATRARSTRHAARPRARGELVLPAVHVRGAAQAALRGAPRLRRAALALQRGARVHQRRPPGRLALAREAHLGRRGPVGPGPRLLRLVRRAAQLLHGALVRPRRRGPDRALLAGDLPHPRQGHPQVPRRLLAGDADGRRHPGAGARADPRLPADARRLGRRDEDVQVARQRARPVRGDGHVRHRRAALLLLPRGLVRPGRRRLDDHVRRALRVRARQRLRQPREPHAGDDRAATATASCRTSTSTPSSRPTSTASSPRSPSCSTAPRSRRRSSASGSACAASTATSRSARRGSSPRTRRRRPSSTSTLRSLAEGIRAVTVLLHPYMPETAAKLLAALGEEELALDVGRLRRAPRRRHASASSRRSSRSRSDRQPHAPRLHARHGRRDRRRRPRGRRHADPHDRHRRRELARARRPPPRRTTRSGSPPATTRTTRPATPTRTRTSCASSRGHPRCAAIGETGLDDYRDYAPRADQERAFAAHIGLARELGKPLVIHTRAAEDDTIATLARDAQGLEVILHCFSMPDRLDECLEHGWWISLRRQRHLPEGARARLRGRARAARPPARRDRRAVPDAAGGAQGAQPARVRRPHGALRRRAPRDRLRGARGGRAREQRPPVRLVSELPASSRACGG